MGDLSGDLHQKDSYQRTAPGIDAKSGALMLDDMTFHGMPLLGLAPPNVHVLKTKEVQISGAQMNGLCRFLSENGTGN